MTMVLGAALFACGEDETETITVDSSMPQGEFTVAESGSIVAQSDTGSKGMVQVGTDEEGADFVKFGSDFETVLATGTVTVFLSTTNDELDEGVFDPGTGNTEVQLIGFVQANGEQYFKLSEAPAAKFDNVILWCASAGIPFGYAEIQ